MLADLVLKCSLNQNVRFYFQATRVNIQNEVGKSDYQQ